MKLYPIEVTNNQGNWGKFAVGQMEAPELAWRSRIDLDSRTPLMRQLGWDVQHLWVLDLQTGEGAMFLPGGLAGADLDAHQIWVCPLFEDFLAWLYVQDLTDLSTLPRVVELDTPFQFRGHRRHGSLPVDGEPADVMFRTPECP